MNDAEPAADTVAAEARRVIALAWPVMLTSLNWTLLQITDVAVVGLTGTREVAAFGASRTLTFVSVMIAVGGMSGILVRASRADGAGDPSRTGAVLREGLVLGLGVGAAIGLVLGWFASPLLRFAGVAPDIAPHAADVVRVMALACPGQLVIIAASYFLEGISRPRPVAGVNLAMLPVNGVLAWAWSGGHLGLPALGAVGAAAATAVASVLGAVAMLAAALTISDARARGVFARSTGTARGALALLRFGLVPGLASGLELGGFSILIGLSTQLGASVAHAFAIVFSVHNVTFGWALGFGSAAGVRVGNAVGEGRRHAALRRAVIAVALAGGSTALLALGIALGAAPLVAAFPATAAVHGLASAMLIGWAPFILFDAVQVVCLYALRSLGDQVIAGVNSIVAYFVVTGGVGMLLVRAGWGPWALVTAAGLGMVTAAALHGARLWAVGRRTLV